MDNGVNTLSPDLAREIHDAEIRLRERAGGKQAAVKAAADRPPSQTAEKRSP